MTAPRSKDSNIFSQPKLLKTWAIQLANNLGGQRVEKTAVLTKLDGKKVNALLNIFAKDYDEQIKNSKSEQEEE